MNSLSRGFGVVSPAAGIRQQSARRIPASSKEASCALIHLDLPHGSVRRAIAERLVGGRRISGRLVQGAKDRECAHSEEVVGSWLYDCLPFLLYSGSYPPNQGGRYRAMITPKVTVELP